MSPGLRASEQRFVAIAHMWDTATDGGRQTPHAEYQTTGCTLHTYTAAGPALISKLGAEVHFTHLSAT